MSCKLQDLPGVQNFVQNSDHLPESGHLLGREFHLACDGRVDGTGHNRIDSDTARRPLKSLASSHLI
jgi:hypothetical protein